MSRIKIIQKYIGYSVLFSLLLLPIFFNGSVSLSESPQTPISSTPMEGSSFENVYITKLNRSIEINDNAYVIIENKFEFLNNRSSSLASVYIGFSDMDMNYLLYYETNDENLSPLSSKLLDGKINGSYILEITLNQPLLPFSFVTVNLKSVFNTNFTYHLPGGIWWGLDLEIFPITPYEIKAYTISTYVPSDSTDVSIDPFFPDEYVSYTEGTDNVFEGIDISPFETKTRNFLYKNFYISYLRMLQLDRTIRINPWGYILVTENHVIKNYASAIAPTLEFEVPHDALNFSMSDSIGEITGIGENPNLNEYGRKVITINLGINRVPLAYDATMVYQIQYSLPYDEYITNNLGTKNLRIDLYPTHMNYIIESQKIKIEILGASSIDRVNFPESQLIQSSSGIILERLNTQITSYHSVLFDITYSTKFTSLISRATIFTLLFIMVFGFYVVLRKQRKDYEEGEESFIEQSVPIRELTRFVTLIEEKNAILLDIEKADSDLRRKRIQKKVYTKTVKNYQNKLKELNEESIPFKRILIETGGQIQSIIQKLDFLEAEKISVKDSVKLLKDRYKRGKLPSKAAYERLSSDMIKQLASSQNKIDRYINELRAYII
nr:hypothetical protein [Candidatus Prometheoarchaeum syntrophicum]QEE16185.1 hypothetical protein DSAG12_02015 [Candidatus Prometheoarchaeum syntrophicum]